MRWIEPEQVRANVEAETWQETIRLAGDLLVGGGFASPDYIKAIIRTVEELGPYFVIAPGIAIAHARPEDGCLQTGFSAISLSTPVEFLNPDNDPVSLVVAFAAKDHSAHVNSLSLLARILASEDFLDRVIAADSDAALASILNGEV